MSAEMTDVVRSAFRACIMALVNIATNACLHMRTHPIVISSKIQLLAHLQVPVGVGTMHRHLASRARCSSPRKPPDLRATLPKTPTMVDSISLQSRFLRDRGVSPTFPNSSRVR
jgi:hypothetical protein